MTQNVPSLYKGNTVEELKDYVRESLHVFMVPILNCSDSEYLDALQKEVLFMKLMQEVYNDFNDDMSYKTLKQIKAILEKNGRSV